MANEKNNNVEVKAEGKMILTRKEFTTKDGRKMWGYQLPCIVRGAETKVDFEASDQGGYEVLDLIFGINKPVELHIHEETMRNDRTGEITNYTVYEAKATDDNGIEYVYKIKPSKNSDKTLLQFYLMEQSAKSKVKDAA